MGLLKLIRSVLGYESSTFTLTVYKGMNNTTYDAVHLYLSSKVSPGVRKLSISRRANDNHMILHVCHGGTVLDSHQGVELTWRFEAKPRELYELSVDVKHKDLVLKDYIPHLVNKAKEMEEERRTLKIYTHNGLTWECRDLDNPSTFDTMAMEDQLKTSLIDDLNQFLRRRNLFKSTRKVGKRGYLLCGPPGTGKFTLVAAMAKYLKFDLYHLKLVRVARESDLKRQLLVTRNRSIVLIEDTDVSKVDTVEQSTLSGLLRLVDGLWSNHELDERLIVFATNHKEKLDQEPGQNYMPIYMGHCTYQGFRTLASNYLSIPCGRRHPLYSKIKRMIDKVALSPAQVAEQLVKTDDADEALKSLVKLLKRKRKSLIDEEKDTKRSKAVE